MPALEMTRPSPAARAAVPTDGEDIFVPIAAGFRLDTGDLLTDTQIRVRLFGKRSAPVVVVAGGISAGRELTGAHGWWKDQVGADAAIDLNQYCALGFDFAPIEDARVRLSPLSQARLIEIALDALGVERIEAWVGASYGGMVGLAFAAQAPQRLSRLCVISAAHRPSPLASAWRGVQRRIVEFAQAQGMAEDGLALARQLAMVTYRSGAEFRERFERGVGEDGRSELDRYLIARGDAYREKMSPQRWLSLSEAIDRCEIDPRSIHIPVTLAASASDQLVPLADIAELADRLPNLTRFETIESIYGHDAFLKESERISEILRQFLGANHG